MKILVSGDRHWSDNTLIRQALVEARHDATARGEILEVVHGDATGADRIAGQIALRLGATVHAHPAQWDAYGKAAGPIRNREMLAAHPDIERVLAFHADILVSKGTRDMVNEADKHGLDIRLYPYPAQLEDLRKRRKQQALF